MITHVFNRRWASVILEALTRHGVRHICIAPGSRSTPLTLEAASNQKFICHTHFDERGLGHLALGLAKASREAVAVIVTSGTAVANLYPSLIEASLTGERIVLLCADRPPELIDCGANQAIRQTEIFSDHPTQQITLPRPTPDISASWLVSTLDHAMAHLTHGALYINCPFAEPLYGEDEGQHQDWINALGDWWLGNHPWLVYSEQQSKTLQDEWLTWRKKRGIVIVSRVDAEDGSAIAEWAENMGWPLLGDVQSHTGQPLPCADLWLSHPLAQQTLRQTEIVIQFGASLTGKRMLQWQASCQPEAYWLIEPVPGRQDPANHQGYRIEMPVQRWLEQHPPLNHQVWDNTLWTLSQQTKKWVDKALNTSWGEAQLAARLPELLPANGQLFIGNSLIIRLIDALAQLPQSYPVYGNRGASGIDGLVSTAAGVQIATDKPTLVVLGDLSALYDLNSFALLKQCSAPVVLIVVNNDGGGIFSLLPTPSAERERFYQMPHHLDFMHAAAMFGFRYLSPASWDELEQAASQAWHQEGVLLLEIKVPNDEGARMLQEFLLQVKTLSC